MNKETFDKEYTDILKKKKEQIQLPLTITLNYPVPWGKNTRDNLIIKRRLLAKDVMEIPSENITLGHMVKLVAKVCEEPLAFIKEIDTIDLFAIIEVVKHFLPGSQETGNV